MPLVTPCRDSPPPNPSPASIGPLRYDSDRRYLDGGDTTHSPERWSSAPNGATGRHGITMPVDRNRDVMSPHCSLAQKITDPAIEASDMFINQRSNSGTSPCAVCRW